MAQTRLRASMLNCERSPLFSLLRGLFEAAMVICGVGILLSIPCGQHLCNGSTVAKFAVRWGAVASAPQGCRRRCRRSCRRCFLGKSPGGAQARRVSHLLNGSCCEPTPRRSDPTPTRPPGTAGRQVHSCAEIRCSRENGVEKRL